LLAGSYLVSLEHALTVWNYSVWSRYPSPVISESGFVSASGGEHYLVAAAVPSPDAVRRSPPTGRGGYAGPAGGRHVSLRFTAGGQSAAANLGADTHGNVSRQTGRRRIPSRRRSAVSLAGHHQRRGLGKTIAVPAVRAGPQAGSTTVQVPDRAWSVSRFRRQRRQGGVGDIDSVSGRPRCPSIGTAAIWSNNCWTAVGRVSTLDPKPAARQADPPVLQRRQIRRLADHAFRRTDPQRADALRTGAATGKPAGTIRGDRYRDRPAISMSGCCRSGSPRCPMDSAAYH